jgi:hypothetical protein
VAAARPLPSEIGATENALRSLLIETLRGTQVAGYEQWVYLNVRESYDGEAVLARAAQVLKEPEDAVRTIQTELTAQGLLDQQGSLTSKGAEALAAARTRVTAETKSLTEGIEAAQVAITAEVLTTIRERAEARLDA